MILLVYITVVLFFPYVLLLSVVGGHGVPFMRLTSGVRYVRGFYDGQRTHEVKEFVWSSSMSLYRYSMSLHKMGGQWGVGVTTCSGRRRKKSRADGLADRRSFCFR